MLSGGAGKRGGLGVSGVLLEFSVARFLVGTSGWSYASWRGPFFPAGIPAKGQLEYYASQFETVELNGVFYRTPTREAVERWRAGTGRDFVFSWKASKFITHWKRLSEDSVDSLQLLEDRLSLLGHKVGPILFQLPPAFAADEGRLGAFLTLLPERRRYSFEFRHPSWYAPNILRMLADRNIALCISDHHDAPAPWERTADYVYLRGHGPSGRYEGRYSRATLAVWSQSILSWQRAHCDVYVYFDNDQKSAAPMDALAMLRLLAEPASSRTHHGRVGEERGRFAT
jgi:uncharacterized protein YecE (DUF72 family)